MTIWKKKHMLWLNLSKILEYVLHSCIIAYVPSNVVKSILTQPDPEEKRAKWIVVLLEYEIEIKPTKLVKVQGLEKMMTNSNCESLQLNFLTSHSNQLDTRVQVMPDFYVSMVLWYCVCVAKFTVSCRVKKNQRKDSDIEIYQVFHSKLIPSLGISWWNFTQLPLGEWT